MTWTCEDVRSSFAMMVNDGDLNVVRMLFDAVVWVQLTST